MAWICQWCEYEGDLVGRATPVRRVGVGDWPGRREGKNAPPMPYAWRVLDADGNALASGWSDDDAGFSVWDPLDYFRADAGAVEIQYQNAFGHWETL